MSLLSKRTRILLTLTAAWFCSAACAWAQNQEIAGSLSDLLGFDRISTTGVPFSLDPDYGLGISYEHRILRPRPVSIFAGIDFVASQLRGVNSRDRSLTRDVATIYLTPDIMVKFSLVPHFTPWATVGGGVSFYEQSKLQLDGARNPATRDISHGAFVFGGGIDIPFWRKIKLRGQVKDFYTGSPSYNTPVSGGQHNVLAGGALVFEWGR